MAIDFRRSADGETRPLSAVRATEELRFGHFVCHERDDCHSYRVG